VPTATAILAAANSLETLLDEHPFAEPNPQALAAIKRICADLRKLDKRAGQIAGVIHAKAQIFYSQWSRARFNGSPATLYTDMRIGLVEQLRALASQLVNEDT